MADSDKTTKSTWLKWLGIVLGFAGVIALVGIVYGYRQHFGGDYSDSGSDLGVFGDFFGGVGGTLIGLINLIVLVMALQIQSVELEETRKALRDRTRCINSRFPYRAVPIMVPVRSLRRHPAVAATLRSHRPSSPAAAR